jgi:hypothetical protein
MNAQIRHSARLDLTDATRLFDLTNQTEARALDWVRRFHQGSYTLLAIRVDRNPDGGCSVRTLTCRRSKQPGTRSEWMSIVYQADSTGVTIRWHTTRTLRDARSAFRVVPSDSLSQGGRIVSLAGLAEHRD